MSRKIKPFAVALFFLLAATLLLAFLPQPALAQTPITDCWQLQNIRDNLTGDYYLVNDIDCSCTSGWNGGAGFEPIGTYGNKFTGTFDGNDHKITNLCINRSSTNYVGLFGCTGSGSEIKDVGLEEVDVSGHLDVGGLVGANCYGTITNSYSSGSVSGSSYDVGGLVGNNYRGTITNSYYPGDDITCTGCDNTIGETTKANLQSETWLTTNNWDFDNIWGIIEGGTYPYLQWSFRICTCGDICVNETGWWYNGGAFIVSNTPIQHAIDNATAGEMICVKDGTYNENVDVGKSLTIRSENGASSTIVHALHSTDHVFHITAAYVNISGFTATGATGAGNAGIYLYNRDYCNISENNCSNNYCGIWLDDSSNNTLTSNTANSNNDYGILLSSSSNNNTLTSNTASNNGYGIYLERSSNNNLSGNTASNNNRGIWLSSSSNNNLSSNTANSNNYYGIRLSSSSNNIIYNNYFNNTNNAYDDSRGNVWNTTKTLGTNIIGGPCLGGNYWSDYTGADTDKDGLGNFLLPYNSSGNIQYGGDSHPLVPVGSAPNLSIKKLDEPDPVPPGGTLNYSISVNNTGNATATDVTVMETYDKNVTFVTAVPAPSSSNDTWQFQTLNVSETRWINISVTVNASVLNGTVLHNIVNVTCDEGVMDTDTENTTVFVASVCVETATGTGLACFVTDSGTIENLVAVNESTLPEEGKPKLVFPHGFFSFNITGLTPNQTVEVTLTLPDIVPVDTEYWKYHASEGGWIRIPMGSDDGDNVVTITLVDGGLGDDDGTANGIIVDQGGPGVRAIKPKLTKSAPTSVAPGGTITYTINYANLGPVALTEVTITENYPEGVTFISAVPAPDAGTNVWIIGTLLPGKSGTIVIKVKVPEQIDLSFTETGSVIGEGFVMVSKDLSTEQKPYRLKNVVTISCAETDPVTASASTTVTGVPGTSLEITEHGSGIYESEEILNFGTKNKSIRLQKSTEAEYQPTAFKFSDGFSVVFTNMWMQDICSKNMVLGDAMHKKIKDATYIKDDTRTETGEYGTSMEFASSFHGAAHIGAVSKDVTTSEDYIGEFEIFWAAKEECQYLFNWSRVPGNDSENLIRFLVDNLAINWAENATITKSDDDRVITIYTDWHSAEVILAANNETATVKVGNETVYVLDVRTEDGSLNLNVYDCRLRKISESVTGEGYVMVDKELTSGHIQVVEHGSGIYSS
ncbi:Cell surface glycoprotein, partial [ANME-1 cluster archaeon GoMg3.2]|nr:Cell surface glycoprotein [ANME-1 cluster archaeon GoMg3.2]